MHDLRHEKRERKKRNIYTISYILRCIWMDERNEWMRENDNVQHCDSCLYANVLFPFYLRCCMCTTFAHFQNHTKNTSKHNQRDHYNANVTTDTVGIVVVFLLFSLFDHHNIKWNSLLSLGQVFFYNCTCWAWSHKQKKTKRGDRIREKKIRVGNTTEMHHWSPSIQRKLMNDSSGDRY